MKIELIKEIIGLSQPQYFTQVDGKYVSGSSHFDINEATKLYEIIKLSQGVINYTEVLKSDEI